MNVATFELPARLTVATVGAVALELRALEGEGRLEVDGTGVEQVDVAGGQLLVALAVARPISLSASEALRELLTSTGMWPHLR